jgi:tripartite ATP-independent transporter DctM subunit
MEWYYILIIVWALILVLFLSGMPVAFAFITINFIGIYIWMGGVSGFMTVISSAFDMLNNFLLVPVPLFVLMGMILFHSGAGWLVIDALDQWIGHIPGRLSVLAIAAGTAFSVVSGVPMGTTAMLGTVMMPEMRRRGYSPKMALGPIMGGGCLSMLIPPSAMAVILGGLAGVSIGKLLIAMFIPGFLLSALYISYILIQAILHPDQVPKYTAERVSLRGKMISLRYIIPLACVVFLVTGVIFFGIATPTEAAATGTLASFILVAAYRKFSWSALNKSIYGSTQVTVMVMIIIIGSVAFSQFLAFTGCTHAMARCAATLAMSPMVLVIAMQIVVFTLGCFMDLISIAMITTPIFMPIVNAIGVDPIWFCTMVMTNLGAGLLTPPFGMVLFTMKGVAPVGTTMGDIIAAALPYFIMNLTVIALMLIFPSIVLWLPGLMK